MQRYAMTQQIAPCGSKVMSAYELLRPRKQRRISHFSVSAPRVAGDTSQEHSEASSNPTTTSH